MRLSDFESWLYYFLADHRKIISPAYVSISSLGNGYYNGVHSEKWRPKVVLKLNELCVRY